MVIVAGPSGSGKTTVGRLLAVRLQAVFVDADDLHPAANMAKMRSGVPLDENDRRPWLESVRHLVDARLAGPRPTVLACSALRRGHRQALGVDRPGVALVWLEAPPEALAARLQARPGHFFPPHLLSSQLAAEERPAAEEAAIVVVADRPVTEVVEAITATLGRPDRR